MTEALATEVALTPPLPPCLVVDVLWEAFTEEGAAAFEEGRSGDALSFWRVAERMAGALADADPRRAASLANLAAATEKALSPPWEREGPVAQQREGEGAAAERRQSQDSSAHGRAQDPSPQPSPAGFAGRLEESRAKARERGEGDEWAAAIPEDLEAQYRRALACWDRVSLWIERMTPDHKPNSSLYHHRLERKYAGAYAEIARRGYRQLTEGGRAACLGNLAGLLHRLGRTDEAVSLYRDAVAVREPALGARDVGAMYLFETLAALLAASGRADDAEAARAKAEAIATNHPLTPRRRWLSEKPVRMSDARRLLAAVYLTPIIRR